MKPKTIILIAASAVVLGALLLGPSGAVRADASIPLTRGFRTLTDRSLLSLESGAANRAPETRLDQRPVSNALGTAALTDEYTIPLAAISDSDLTEPFGSRGGRFCKVPRYLAPLYERAARDYRIPVRYLLANGAYESRFEPRLLGDSGRSCGIHQFHHFRKVAGQRDWSLWGFGSLERCQDPEANIRTVARVWRDRMDNTDPNYRCNGLLSCAIRLHKGQGAVSYMQTVMAGADRYYSPAHSSPS